MRIWITRDALDSGVVVADAEINERGWAERRFEHVRFLRRYPPGGYATTREHAVEQVEALRSRRIASLEKLIAKLRALKIEVPE